MEPKTQDFSFTQNKGGVNYTYILRVTQNSVDVQRNCSNITVDAILKSDKDGTSFVFQYFEVYVYLNGSKVIGASAYRTCKGMDEHLYETWTGEVDHDENGELMISVSGALMCLPAGYSWLPFIDEAAFATCEFECMPIIRNSPPETPRGLTAPLLVVAGSDVYIQWELSEDQDGNLTGFELERSDNGGESFNLLYSGSNAAFPDEASAFAGTEMHYRVRAYDEQGAYSEWSDTVTVRVNSPPGCTKAPELFMDQAGIAPAVDVTAGRPLWLYPGRWNDPDNNLSDGYLEVQIQTKDLDDVVGDCASVLEVPVSAQLLQVTPQVPDDISYIRFRVACVDALGAASEWTVTEWLKRNVPFSFCDGQWMKPKLDGLAVMPYVRIAGVWVRHGGLVPDPKSSRLGFGKLGEMILGG